MLLGVLFQARSPGVPGAPGHGLHPGSYLWLSMVVWALSASPGQLSLPRGIFINMADPERRSGTGPHPRTVGAYLLTGFVSCQYVRGPEPAPVERADERQRGCAVQDFTGR